MEFPQTLTIDKVTYQLVDIQRGQVTAIYKNDSEYVRIGDSEKITTDLAAHKAMVEAGFPVAQIFGEGELDGLSYFREQSLGEKCFGILFKEEYEAHGQISDATWRQFVAVCEQFARAQLTTRMDARPVAEFRDGIHLDIACAEEPSSAELFSKAQDVVDERLSNFPYVISHGDLTPFNMYPLGVIDLEDSFAAPAGFDLMALSEHLEWFPETSDDMLHQLYRFTSAQRADFLVRIDTIYASVGLPQPSLFLSEYTYAKGVWFAVRLDKYPILRSFRYAHLVEVANRLLATSH